MNKLIISAFAALSAGASFANIASVDQYKEINWFENVITTTLPQGWSGTEGQAAIKDGKLVIDADAATPVSFAPPAKTGTVVSQVFDIMPEPVTVLPDITADVQTGLVVFDDGAGNLSFKAYARTSAEGTAEWLTLSGTPSADGQKIAIEADYATTPAKIKFLLVNGETETELKVADVEQLYSATSATTVTAYDFTGSGKLASLSGTQTADTAVIIAGVKYTAEEFTADVLATAVSAGNQIKVIASDFTAPADYKIVNGFLVAKVYVAQVGDNKYESLADALTAAGEDPTQVVLIDKTIAELPEGYADYKIVDGKIVAKVYIAQVGETKYESFGEALAQGGTVKLLADLTADAEIAIVKPTTLDLGGFTLTSTANDDGDAIWVKGIADNSLTIKNGTVSGTQIGIYVSKGAKLIVDSTATIETTTQQAIFLAGGDADIAGTVKAAKDAVVIMSQTKEWNVERASTVTVSGTIIAGTNGALLSFGEDTNEHVVTILEGAKLTVTDAEAEDSAAIYWPSAGKLTVEGGTLTAAYAVQQRSGAIALNGGTLNGKVVIEDGKDGSAYPAGTPAATIAAGLVAAEDLVVIARDGYESAWTTTEGGLTLGFTEIIETDPLDSAVASELIAAGKTTVKLADGATFTYDKVPEEAQAITIETTGTVKVVGDEDEKPVVDNISVVEGGALIFENVTKVFTAFPTDDERTLLQNADAWKNCVAVIKDVTTTPDGGAKIYECGNETSSLVIDSSKFWLHRESNADMTKVAFPVEIAGSGFIVDGTSAAKYPFAKVSGSGAITFKGDNAAALVIEDASEFTGSIDANKAVYLNATVGDTTATGKIVIPAETEMTVAEGKTYTVETIEVNGTLTATADQLKATSITGAGLVDLSSKDYVNAELTVLEKMASTLTAKVNNFKGYFSGGVARDNYVVNVPPTIEILGTFEVSGGYSRTPNWKGVISKIKGGEDAVFKVSINVDGRCDIEIGNLDDYAGTLALANNSWLILPNGDVTVDGAKAKFADATKSTYTTNANDAIAAAQTGTTATGVTIFDATGVTVPDGYTLAADGTLTRKLYYKEMTDTGRATDWVNIAGIKFADVNGAEMTYTDGDTIIINKSLVAYMHDGMAGAKLAVEGENTVQIIRSGDGSGADYALKGVALTIGEGATVVVPCCEANGWNSYATSKAKQSELYGATIDGAGTLVVPTRTDKNGNSAPAKVVLTNTTIADTVTVTLDEGSTIVVDADSSMPEPVLGTTTTADVKVLTSTEGGVTTYTVGVEQGEEWTDVTDDKPISDVVPAEQAAALEAAGATTKAVVDWAKAHAAGTKPGDAISLEAFALDLDNTATEEQIAEAAKNLTVTIEMVDGVAKASVVLKNGLKVNVEPVMKGKANLSDKDWSDDLTGKKFFKAFIDL